MTENLFIKNVPEAFSTKRMNEDYICIICGWRFKQFLDTDYSYGHIYRNSRCPVCGSQPRHRTLYLYLKHTLPRNKRIKLLDFSPYIRLYQYLKTCSNVDYIAVDINPQDNNIKKENITRLSFKKNAFDVILCAHILEHVENDIKAMSELYRVLKEGGSCIISVPVDYTKDKTFEDQAITSPEERTKKFWGFDHVRLYGKDIKNRLENVGFKVDLANIADFTEKENIRRYGMVEVPFYLCAK